MALGTFACFCIENRLGVDLSTGLEQALRHYARRLESAKKPAPPPEFLRDRVLYDKAAELELPVEPEVEAALVRESRAQRVSMDQLFAHAVFVYLADLDSSGGFRVSA